MNTTHDKIMAALLPVMNREEAEVMAEFTLEQIALRIEQKRKAKAAAAHTALQALIKKHDLYDTEWPSGDGYRFTKEFLMTSIQGEYPHDPALPVRVIDGSNDTEGEAGTTFPDMETALIHLKGDGVDLVKAWDRARSLPVGTVEERREFRLCEVVHDITRNWEKTLEARLYCVCDSREYFSLVHEAAEQFEKTYHDDEGDYLGAIDKFSDARFESELVRLLSSGAIESNPEVKG
jgi:hypothetical protein